MKDRPPVDASNPGIYAVGTPVSPEVGSEQERADAISRLGASDATAPGTFLPEGSLLDDPAAFGVAWDQWRTEMFTDWLGPRFIEIHLAAARMESDRIAEIDWLIDAALDEPTRQRSLSAALPFLEGRTEIRSQPQWVKFLKAQEEGHLPGHLTSIFSLQAALFHLPLLPALTAYVNFEGANGHAAMRGGERFSPAEFSQRFPEGSAAARLVFQSPWDSDGDSGLDSGARLASV